MFLKQINTSIKLNFFKKLFLLTTGIVFLTLLTGFLFNLLFFDKFYIYRKKEQMLTAKNSLLKVIGNEEQFETLAEIIDDTSGIKVDIYKINNSKNGHMMKSSHMMSSRASIFNSLKENEGYFTSKESNNTSGVVFLRYYERLDNNILLSVRSSLSVMSEHIHDAYIFNFFIGLFSLLISSILVFIFSKKITKNITSLKNSAEEISQLKHPQNIIVNSGDELEELSISLDKMSQDLFISMDNLKTFVSNASHELKTPISVLCLYSQALARDNVEESKKKEYYKILLKKSLEMKGLTESLLTLSKINSPDYKLNLRKINLQELVEDSIENYDYLEFEKDLEIVKDITPVFLNGDYGLLKITFNNLIHNMFKYSPDGTTSYIYLNGNSFIVKNSLDENLNLNTENIFQPFSRGNNALNKKVDGNGLGLSLVKKILELSHLNYKILIDENSFTFTIYF